MMFFQVIAVIHALFDVVGLPANLLVILTISFERRLLVMRYILLASLAVSDFLNLILVNSFRIASIAQETWLYGQTMCHFNSCFHLYFYVNTIVHLVAVSYDRYKAIVRSPLTYNGTITTRKALLMILIWFIPVPFSIGPFLGIGMYVYNQEVFFCENGWLVLDDVHETAKVFFTIAFFVGPFLVIVFLNWSVYKTAKTQIRALAQEAQTESPEDSEENHHRELSRRKRERKASVDVVVVIAAFLLCFLPLWVVSSFRQYEKSIKVPPQLILATNCLFLVSSLCNPIIYAIRKRDFRDAVRNIFRRFGLLGSTNATVFITTGLNHSSKNSANISGSSPCTFSKAPLALVTLNQGIRATRVDFQPTLYTIPEIDGY